MPELLVEVGIEEMPAPWLPGLAEQLRERFLEAASRERLEPGNAAVAWTPRRLVLRAELEARQPDREEPVWGPPLKQARDNSGSWTPAALGFAKKNGVAVDSLQQRPKDEKKPDELYLLFVRQRTGAETRELVPGLLASVLRALAFPKRMSWDAWLDDGRGAFPFGRPIRWLVVLLGGEAVPFAIHRLVDGAKGPVLVESSNQTRGHRFLPKGRGGEPAAVSSYAELREALRERFVILEPQQRGSRIVAQLRAAAAGAGAADASAIDDHGLVEEWRDLVEYPTVLVGRVPEEFRELPPEVLETVLVHHQKYVSLRDRQGRIDRFAAIVNGDASSASEIVRGMERVVVARLRDARFFLAEDRKRPLAERVGDLAGVTFHRGLGSYQDKSRRMVALVEELGRRGVLTGDGLAAATQAARLAKADLVTLMVREFPELQGTMGALYLAGSGLPDEATEAVRWHYHPLAVEPEAPPHAAFAGRDRAARVFAAVSLADKLDTLAGYFSIGESPTGSRDPYGLRRAGQGAVRAVLDFWRPQPGEPVPDLEALARAALAGFEEHRQGAETSARELLGFLLDRLEHVLQARGLSADEVAAAVHVPGADAGGQAIRALADPLDALRRATALQRIRREKPEDFTALAEAFKRAKNIVSQAPEAAAIEPSLFENDAERGLFSAVASLEKSDGSLEDRLRGLAGLRVPVGRFFDDVLVMAEDPRVRANRLALLRQALSLFYRIADISRLGGTS